MSGSAVSRTTRRRSIALVGGALLAAIGAAAFGIHGGLYNVAADIPHTQPVFWLMTTVRERSIAVRAAGAVVPSDLADPKRIAAGAGEYAEMCSGCHLAPGMKRTEISQGLYPRAPELRRGSGLTPAEEFWVVKHGLKMSGMPAWGVTHNDELLWSVVAFLRKLPELTPEQYRTLIKSAPKTHDEMMHEMEMDESHGAQPLDGAKE
jgi:mono/diheme cytochrome c family protein